VTDLTDRVTGVIEHPTSHLELLGSPQLTEANAVLGQSPDDGARGHAPRVGELLQPGQARELPLGRDVLERAIKAGWRDYYVRRNDPYWAALENEPRYRALMATVKADIDRQRAEVERIDATDDFKAKLDAAMATRREARQQPGEP
jgi:hypothetical protein